MHLEFLVEDSSGAKLISSILPQIIGKNGADCTWKIHAYKGIGRLPANLKSNIDPSKRALLNRLPSILKGYGRTPGIDAVIVVVDTDRRDCKEFLVELKSILTQCAPAPNTLFRLAIEEMEAWYFGDRYAILGAYPRAKINILNSYQQDSICGTWELLADAVYPGGSAAVLKQGWPLPGQLKHEWAENIGPNMTASENISPSFQKFVSGLERLIAG